VVPDGYSNTNIGTGLRLRSDDPRDLDLADKILLMYNIWRYEESTYLRSVHLSRNVA
jgi:hypothetical protein